jgi:hypothetical protein
VSELERGASLDLDEDEVVAIFRNDVYLAGPASPVSIENDKPVPDEKGHRLVFAASPAFLISHAHHLRAGVCGVRDA